MNVKFSTKFVAASAAAVMALSLAGCSGGSMDDSSSSSAKASGDSITIGTVTTNSGRHLRLHRNRQLPVPHLLQGLLPG